MIEVDLFGMKYPITDEEELRAQIEKILADDFDDADYGDYAVVREPLMERD
ncbi:MAG: hypothetical protein IJK81_00435 [Selenomonadaceae bacterium]|nr:hypothetical protein [Selenomonadaceae bacterium]